MSLQPAATAGRDAFHSLAEPLARLLPVFAIIALHTVIVLMIVGMLGAQSMLAHHLYVAQWTTVFLVLCPLVSLIVFALRLIHVSDDWSVRRDWAARRLTVHRLAHMISGIMLLLATMIFMGSFTTFKNMMPIIQGGYPFDKFQSDLDALLHFGRHPFELLYAIGKHELVRHVIEFNYNVVWFIACFYPLFWVAFSERASAVRTRYFVCFVLVWIVLGNIVALAFLSAGPAFYHHFADDGGRFTEQLAFLAHGIDGSHSAARFQAYLWSSYESGQGGLGTGISAFPSVHVGLATMNALFVREYSRSLGVLAFIYVGFIVLSSVYLGWHYAIDGYASIILVIALHMAVKRYLPRFRSLTSVTAS